MSFFIKISSPLLVIFMYLFAAYGGFYFFVHYKNLKSPFQRNSFVVQGIGDASAPSVKYVALGDSLTAGVGSYDAKYTYVYEFAEKLAKTDGKVEVLNLGIPGAEADDVINKELARAIKEQPDVVSLLIGVNDIHEKKLIWQFGSNYNQILTGLLTQTNAKIYVLTLPYIGSSKIVLPPFNYILNWRTKQFNSAILTLVDSFHSDRIHVIDLYTNTYVSSQTDPNYYSSDLFHPSEYGYNLWGKFLNVN